MSRIFVLIFLLLAAILCPPYFSVVVFVFCVSFFSKYYEGFLAALFLDALYFSPFSFEKYHLGFFTVSFFLAFLCEETAKRFVENSNIVARTIVMTAGILPFSFFFIFWG